MKRHPNDTVKMLQFPGLDGDCNISHFITTRHGGVSQGSYATFNPGAYSGDDPEAVCHNRQLLAEAVGFDPKRLFAPYQVHGDKIGVITPAILDLSEEEQAVYMHATDALVTNVPEVCVAVSTADCVPVLLYDPKQKVVAAIHAGWRGTVQQIVAKTVRLMVNEYGSDPACLLAGIAPSIGIEAFEVGEEVADAFRETGVDMSRIMKRNTMTGKVHLDLWEANRLQLLEAGLVSEHIEVAGICTHTHHEEFFSARRLGIHSGRILSGILILSNQT